MYNNQIKNFIDFLNINNKIVIIKDYFYCLYQKHYYDKFFFRKLNKKK